MKKLIALAMVLASANVAAHMGGTPTLSAEQLQAGWNGQAGPQVTSVMGIRAHWKADAEGRPTSKSLPVCAALPVDEQQPNVTCVDYMPTQGGGSR